MSCSEFNISVFFFSKEAEGRSSGLKIMPPNVMIHKQGEIVFCL